MRLVPFALVLGLFATPALAQESQQERPADWKVRFDNPAPDDAIDFVTMAPGWHVTTGPRAILYKPSQVASGAYRLESTIHLFPSSRREGFGVFVGGENLDGPNQSYLYFLIRGDGHYLIKHRAGDETQVIVPWTEHEAIVGHEGQEGTAENTLAIECSGESVDFYVNGQKVNSLPRSEMDVEGVVGLRVNHRLDIHVAGLSVSSIGA
ncbi:MAG: hypothetical protein GWN99_00215 [Gemmatimonadetes bacterium]|uniref:3-keto-disaccharide hydrolase domain-containing protein n=1 Tax=Candidatus Kutchimonas denitrificans TaxID=3056748 RepID=A0AAE5C7K8_9BACT|nr:hypothetical protein [Gemmatimonadota bacterium]NIR73531.1 hypothetical protein [Candidatus Kutchimonas denitrificans]NIR99490.1 hypothetical protein [Gemmatimonadota bacterium]NIT65110.1 hypothetical protein [Gemmatimonadota bacterium]NIV23643.1 hypothetical protein [Gemmatimonadota bacterium]